MPAAPLSIAQVTPFAWESGHPVNEQVEGLSRALAARGHRVTIVAPTASRTRVRDSRRLVRAARERPEGLLGEAGGEPLMLGVGEVLPFAPARRRAASVPVDVARTIEDALETAPFDVVQLHEPFGPSAASAALRHSRALNVGSFHAPTERLLSTQVARRVTELFLGRLDARTASFAATRDLLARWFPADYELLLPGAAPAPAAGAEAAETGPVRIAYLGGEERGGLRVLLRALRRLPAELDWRARVVLPRGAGEPATLRADVRARIEFLKPGAGSAARALDGAALAVSGSAGASPNPDGLVRAIAAGVVPVAANLPVYEELTRDGELGPAFAPGDADTLAAHLEALIGDAALRASLAEAAGPLRARLTFPRLADDVEAICERLVARRHDGRAKPRVGARVAKRPLIDVDLHMHTDHSHDCATPVEALLAQAKAKGLGAIAVTDHNEISGALEAREKAKGTGTKVIVGEEVKTASQGEVIGLFLERKIPRGLTLEETIAEIRRQGGLVYVPHPFDRMHSVPDYEHLLAVLDDVDAIEVFNPRVAISEFNEEAARFAEKYRIPAGAGSDAHVVQGLGSVRIRMRDFDGPEEFLESLRDADIVRRPASLLYVQALKFLQTKATPAPARRAVRERRVRRASRKS